MAVRPVVRPNLGFAAQLQAFEERLKPIKPEGPALSKAARPLFLATYVVDVCGLGVDVQQLDECLRQVEHYDVHAALEMMFGRVCPEAVAVPSSPARG
mmetsp:Transcript_100849/g.314384  ORF Transcript_100849/g.314384 Transcript_100849/m.314384 type:complete len:98 (+) Transcript_100849:182-475(+)